MTWAQGQPTRKRGRKPGQKDQVKRKTKNSVVSLSDGLDKDIVAMLALATESNKAESSVGREGSEGTTGGGFEANSAPDDDALEPEAPPFGESVPGQRGLWDVPAYTMPTIP
jgi:hypothetical protein